MQDASQGPVLLVDGLAVSIGSQFGQRVDLVRDATFTVAQGEVLALLGESGSGKSVSARAIIGLTPAAMHVRANALRLGTLDLLALTPEERQRVRGRRIGLVLQDALSALNPVLPVGAQLGERLRVHQGHSRGLARKRSIELLDLVGIPNASRRIADYPHQFSGGMRQRILIAMAISLEPELLIADEPTTALDVTVQAQILGLLTTLRRELGLSILLITHDIGVVTEMADRVAVMYAGRVVESGPTTRTLADPAHPYLAALLASSPHRAVSGHRLPVIPGSPPSPALLPDGCTFHPRCSVALPDCARWIPARTSLFPGHSAECLRLGNA